MKNMLNIQKAKHSLDCMACFHKHDWSDPVIGEVMNIISSFYRDNKKQKRKN